MTGRRVRMMPGATQLMLHDTSCIGKHAAELKRIAYLASHVSTLLTCVHIMAMAPCT